MIWKKLSTFFLLSTFLFFALDSFFIKYIGGAQFLFFASIVSVSGMLLSELMILVLKVPSQTSNRGNPMRNRVMSYRKIVIGIFGFAIVLGLINDIYLNKVIPLEIIGYIFFLSTGIYIGFFFCINGVNHAMKNDQNERVPPIDEQSGGLN
jgi:hypothetical protein